MGYKDRKRAGVKDPSGPGRQQDNRNELVHKTRDDVRRMGFQGGRNQLGFKGHRALPEIMPSGDDFTITQAVGIPEKLAGSDDMLRSGLMEVGGPIDLFDDEEERKKRAYYRQRFQKKLSQVARSTSQLGDFFDKSGDVSAVSRSFSPTGAAIEPKYRGNIMLTLRGNGKHIDVETSDLPRLVYLTMKHGRDWVYEQIEGVGNIEYSDNGDDEDKHGSAH